MDTTSSQHSDNRNTAQGFVSEMVAKTGLSASTIYDSLLRANTFTDEQVDILKRKNVTKTDATKLARLDEIRRQEILSALDSGRIKSVKEMLLPVNSQTKEIDITMTAKQLDQTISDIAGQLAPSSKRIYLNDTKYFAEWIQHQGLTPLTISRSDMIAYRQHLAESKYAKTTKQRMFRVAVRLMNEQYVTGLIKEKVTEGVKGFKTDNDETTHTALSKAEAKDMLESIDRNTKQGKRDYALILMLVKTGMRRAELVALNRSDIKIMDGHHVAVIEHGKGDKRRIVKLRVDVYRALEEYLQARGQEGEALFVSFRRGDHPTNNRMTDKAVELLVKKYAPVGTELTPHGLRATFATLALEAEASLHQVQYALGHADPRTTERYQRRKLNLDNNAVDVLNF